MGADDARLQVLESAQVLNDIAAGIVEEQLAVLGAPHSDDPFEVVAILEQIVDGLRHATARNDRNLRAWLLFLFLLGHRFNSVPGGKIAANCGTSLGMRRELSQ